MRNHLMLLANMASLVVAIYICCNFTLHLLPLLVGTALCLFNVGQIVCQVNN